MMAHLDPTSNPGSNDPNRLDFWPCYTAILYVFEAQKLFKRFSLKPELSIISF